MFDNKTKPKKIFVGLSGGVDSAVAAALLIEAGYHVEGLFMKNWDEDDTDGYCAAEEDLREAQKVAATLEIPLHKVNFAKEYWDRVFVYFLDEYKNGRTPNPDILCNSEIKFRSFLKYALRLGADGIATGHYAQISCDKQLLRSADANKDQTYFLYRLTQSQLSQALFPIGHFRKTEVRALAKQYGLPNYSRKDSTGICFIGEKKLKSFLSKYLPATPGKIVTLDGTVIGEHAGLMFYTIGQRQGLHIGGIAGYPDAPWFVIDKDLSSNRLIVGQGHNHPALYSQELTADSIHWITGKPLATHFSAMARIRHRQPLVQCIISIRNHEMQVSFEQPVRAITPGQSIVVYNNEHCLGGGIIKRAHKKDYSFGNNPSFDQSIRSEFITSDEI